MTFKFWPRLGLPLLLACGLACAPESGGAAPAPGRDAGPQTGKDAGQGRAGGSDAPADTRTVATRTGTTRPTRTGTGEVGDVPWVDLIDPATWPQTPDAAPAPLPAAAQAVAGELHGAFLRVECASEEIELQYCHPQDKGIREIPLRIGGEPGRTYQVTVARVGGDGDHPLRRAARPRRALLHWGPTRNAR